MPGGHRPVGSRTLPETCAQTTCTSACSPSNTQSHTSHRRRKEIQSGLAYPVLDYPDPSLRGRKVNRRPKFVIEAKHARLIPNRPNFDHGEKFHFEIGQSLLVSSIVQSYQGLFSLFHGIDSHLCDHQLANFWSPARLQVSDLRQVKDELQI